MIKNKDDIHTEISKLLVSRQDKLTATATIFDTDQIVVGDGIHFPNSINWIGHCCINGMHKIANAWYEVDLNTVAFSMDKGEALVSV